VGQSAGFLLDTNIIVALIRANPLGKSIDQQYDLRASLNRSMVCVVTVGEMLSLAHKFEWGTKKTEELRGLLGEIVWLDINHPEILDAYGEIDYATSAAGMPMGKNDVWVAAVAKVSGATLLTTDRDFDQLQGTFIDRIWIDPGGSKNPP
jgi:predicted nucleic acid-binding protein